MQRFAAWLENEENELPEIKGEYWIVDGSTQFADGDIGDYNHEVLAAQHIIFKFADKIRELAEELGIEEEKNWYGRSIHDDEEHPQVDKLLEQIRQHLEEKTNEDPDNYIQKFIGANNEEYSIINGADARTYVVLHDGWIAVKGHNIELFDYLSQKKSLSSGLGEIFEQEGHWQDFDPAKLDFRIFEHKSGKTIDATLADIENIQPAPRPQLNFAPQKNVGTNVGDKRFVNIKPDATENKPTPKLSNQSEIDAEAKKKKIIGPGQQLWRGTSESLLHSYKNISFKEWLFNICN